MADFTLFYNPRSPFARRIRLALHRLKLPFTGKDVGNVFSPQTELWSLNPLGMVPTLVTPENEIFSDSANLLEHLHDRTGKIWPHDWTQKNRVRQASVWCAGIMQSSILYFQETGMHSPPSPYWASEHLQAIQDTLTHLNRLNESIWIENGEFTQAAWDICCALEYADIRAPMLGWREKYEGFVRLMDQARQDPYFVETFPRL
jgi:glutathione S-transferase